MDKARISGNQGRDSNSPLTLRSPVQNPLRVIRGSIIVPSLQGGVVGLGPRASAGGLSPGLYSDGPSGQVRDTG